MSEYKKAAEYIPHAAPMMLLDEVVLVTHESAICRVCVDDESVLAPFLNEQHHLPAWFAIELMAQTIGVWNGWHASQHSLAPQLGLLLGGRGCKTTLPYFPKHSVLTITVEKELQDEKLASFNCYIEIEQQKIAQARLNVYQPDAQEIKQLLQREETA